MKRVLVTGGRGFLGRHVMRQLKCLPDMFCNSTLGKESEDLRDPLIVHRAYRAYRPDVVVHLAANAGGIQANLRTPAAFLHDNLMMGMLLLDGARRWGVRRFVLIASACGYDPRLEIPYKESDYIGGRPHPSVEAYALAKKTVALHAEMCQQDYELQTITLILTNLYGPCDHFEEERSHVVPALVRRFVKAKDRDDPSVTVWGSGEQTRDFVYVEDAARAITLAIDSAETGLFNIGSGVETSIMEISRRIANVVGYKGEIHRDFTKPVGTTRRLLSIDRANAGLGWYPRTSLQDGLANTVGWYREHR